MHVVRRKNLATLNDEMKKLSPALLVFCSTSLLLAAPPVTPEPSTYGIGIGVLALGYAVYRKASKRK